VRVPPQRRLVHRHHHPRRRRRIRHSRTPSLCAFASSARRRRRVWGKILWRAEMRTKGRLRLFLHLYWLGPNHFHPFCYSHIK
jgi:hypothetical protein